MVVDYNITTKHNPLNRRNREVAEEQVASVEEMARVHLMNVEREIVGLEEKRVAIVAEVERLSLYLKQGRSTLGVGEPVTTPESA